MPIGKAAKNGSMLYTVIIFAALFVIATAAAVILFLKAAEFQKEATQAKKDLSDLASNAEISKIPTLIGKKQQGKTTFGSLNIYLDKTVSLILGSVPPEASAEAKMEAVEAKAAEVANELKSEPSLAAMAEDINDFSFARAVEVLKGTLDNTKNTAATMEDQLKKLQDDFDNSKKLTVEKEDQLIAQIKSSQKAADEIQASYTELKNQMQLTTDEQVQALLAKITQAETTVKETRDELLKVQAELTKAQNKIGRLDADIQKTMPKPDSEAAAFTPDGKIISVDNSSKTAVISLGSNDHVYRGLTFTVYDKGAMIPASGKGKAEIEVLDVQKNISIVRVSTSDPRNTILPDDIIANLIWDKDRKNNFVVAGQFDLDGDGAIDRNGAEKVIRLIENWGGTVSGQITSDTDFLVLGSAPVVLQKPTAEQTDAATAQKYETARKEADTYNQLKSEAAVLYVPIFNYERFLYFIGYKTASAQPGRF